MIFDIINAILSLIPFIDAGKMKISFDLNSLEFFQPIVGKQHWTEENYKSNPIRYRMKCKVAVFNGKRDTYGINKCSFNLKCKNALAVSEKTEGNFDSIKNIPSKEYRETEIYQDGIIFYGENLSNGFTLTFNYYENGKKKEKELIVKKV